MAATEGKFCMEYKGLCPAVIIIASGQHKMKTCLKSIPDTSMVLSSRSERADAWLNSDMVSAGSAVEVGAVIAARTRGFSDG